MIIFSDGPKILDHAHSVSEVRDFITNIEGFKTMKSKKDKQFKILELKGGIKEDAIDTSMSKELNMNNLLTLIGNNRQQNQIKFK